MAKLVSYLVSCKVRAAFSYSAVLIYEGVLFEETARQTGLFC